MAVTRLGGRQVMEHCGRGPEPVTVRGVAVEIVRFVLAAMVALCAIAGAFVLAG